MLFSDPKNIEYVIYLLVLISMIVMVILIKNNKKKKINTNLVKHEEYMEKEGGESLAKQDSINWKFNISKIALFLKHKKNIFNPEVGKDDYLIGIEKFFINFQKNFLLWVKENVLHYNEQEVQMIKRKIWKLDLNAIRSVLQGIHVKKQFSQVWDYSLTEGILKKLIIITLKHPLYTVMDESYRENLEKWNLEKQRVMEKKKNGLELTKSDEWIFAKIKENKIIYDELIKKHKKNKIDFLDFLSDKNELHVEVSYNVLFEESYHEFISFYKKKGIAVKTYFK